MSNPQLAERAADWDRALGLYDAWQRASHAGSTGHRASLPDPAAIARAKRYRAELEAIVERYGWQGTRADPMLSWMARQQASWDMPEVTR